MKTLTIIKVAVWFILFLALLGVGFEMVSKPNIIENIIGFFICVSLSLFANIIAFCSFPSFLHYTCNMGPPKNVMVRLMCSH